LLPVGFQPPARQAPIFSTARHPRRALLLENPRRIEALTQRNYPFGNQVKQELRARLPPGLTLGLQATARLPGRRLEVTLTLTRVEQPAAGGRTYARLVAGSLHNDALLLNRCVGAIAETCCLNGACFGCSLLQRQDACCWVLAHSCCCASAKLAHGVRRRSVLLEEFPSPYTTTFVVDSSQLGPGSSVDVVATVIQDKLVGLDVSRGLKVPPGAALPWPAAPATAGQDGPALEEGVAASPAPGLEQEQGEAPLGALAAAAGTAGGQGAGGAARVQQQGGGKGARGRSRQSTLQAAFKKGAAAAAPQPGSHKAKTLSHFAAASASARRKPAAGAAEEEEGEEGAPPQPFRYSPDRPAAAADAFDRGALSASIGTWSGPPARAVSLASRAPAAAAAAAAVGGTMPPPSLPRASSSSSRLPQGLAGQPLAALSFGTGMGNSGGAGSIFERFKLGGGAAAAPPGPGAGTEEEEEELLGPLHAPPQPLLPSSLPALPIGRKTALQSRYQQLMGAAGGGSLVQPPKQQLQEADAAKPAAAGLEHAKARLLRPSNAGAAAALPAAPQQRLLRKGAGACRPAGGRHPGWDLSSDDEENQDSAAASGAQPWRGTGQQPAGQRLPSGAPLQAAQQPAAGGSFWQGREGQAPPAAAAAAGAAARQAAQQPALPQPPLHAAAAPAAPAAAAAKPQLRKPQLRPLPKRTSAWDDLLEDFMLPSQQQPAAAAAAAAAAPGACRQQGTKRAAVTSGDAGGGGDWLDDAALLPELKRRATAPGAEAGAMLGPVPLAAGGGAGGGAAAAAGPGLPAAGGGAAARRWHPLSQARLPAAALGLAAAGSSAPALQQEEEQQRSSVFDLLF
jgi:hypothetical protein